MAIRIYVTVSLAMAESQPPRAPRAPENDAMNDRAPRPPDVGERAKRDTLYCPTCAREVDDPLTCGDCSAVICRVCGTPLEAADDLAMG